MTDHAVIALRKRREEIARQVHNAEKRRRRDAATLPVTKMIVARLGALARRGEITKDGGTRNAKWAGANVDSSLNHLCG